MNLKKQEQLIQQMTPNQLQLQLYLSQAIILVIAFGLGFFLFRPFADILPHLRLDGFWIFIGIFSGLIVAAIDMILWKVLPHKYYDDGGINEKLFQNMPVWKIALIALLVACSEEILFRGIIQTKVGIIAASLIFAFIHMRYWRHWFLIVNVVVLSFWIGLIYSMSGHLLLPVIAMHFTIDFILGLYISKRISQT
ncbi:CPBP family intramembrane glutamic endopeptidase [Bacillus sp. FJAT-50079]|uniref:CPBP family intramembrane glutamic endopeptidase n=1 Tax=Bacillus sp. FJAT-50079 TaxID=2833577 RepID=UPI001BC9A2F1|nr:CPBP family intramembrane glutamic endopeptidase [Bacillus sp. FJAT-50079]MBS4209728.1 CPBP family intramembrane metalloprotease [Bacillus sp. FJAT-50079]